MRTRVTVEQASGPSGLGRKGSGLLLSALLTAALMLSACGVRGPLEPPPQATAAGDAKSADATDPGENSAAPPKAHEPFVLDGLLR